MIKIEMFESTDPRFETVCQIRTVVFMNEQGATVDEEFDEFDATTTQFLLLDDGVAVGVGRLFEDGHLGRLAILKRFRCKGYGRLLVQAMLDVLITKGVETAVLGAQVHAVGFYEQFGFAVYGEPFVEAGINHRSMKKSLINHG